MEIYIHGTLGYGESYMLAALAVVLNQQSRLPSGLHSACSILFILSEVCFGFDIRWRSWDSVRVSQVYHRTGSSFLVYYASEIDRRKALLPYWPNECPGYWRSLSTWCLWKCDNNVQSSLHIWRALISLYIPLVATTSTCSTNRTDQGLCGSHSLAVYQRYNLFVNYKILVDVH